MLIHNIRLSANNVISVTNDVIPVLDTGIHRAYLNNMQSYYVYILASKYKGTLYTGVTSDLIKRVWEHKNKTISGFTSKYDICRLVYFEEFQDINLAISREKILKSWKRKWKTDLIGRTNQKWKDLYDEISQ